MYNRHKYNSDEEYRNSIDWHRDIARRVNEGQNEFHQNDPKNTCANFYGDCDHPNTLENGSATILYIIIMLAGSIFNDRMLIWVTATFIWLKFITRHIK